MTTRRSFLRGLFAAPAIVAASSLMPINPRLLAPMAPKLWGDGIHDDTKALQWLLDNARYGIVDLNNKVYRTTGTIYLPARGITLTSGTINADHSSDCAIFAR